MSIIEEMFGLDGLHAVVTGSRRGIGRAYAIGLAQAGAHVTSLDRAEPTETREGVLAAGSEHAWQKIDLATATPEELQAAIGEIEARRPIDILVNNAGICPRQPVLEHASALWEEALRVNLSAVWYLSQAAARPMVARGRGKIVVMASLLSFQGGMTVPGYAATKHGVVGLVKSLANELASKGVNVNAIAPGYIRTDLTEPLERDPERNARISQRIPAGRWGEPRDLVWPCVFLASRASDYMHGAVVPVDGGWLAM